MFKARTCNKDINKNILPDKVLSDSTKKKIPEPVKKIYRIALRYTQTSKNMLIYPLRYKYGYNRDHYLIGDNAERKSYKMGILRPGDMGAALAYALGVRTYSDVVKIFGIDTGTQYYLPENTSCREQADQLIRHQTRRPSLVVDVGCGRGEISALLTHVGIECIPIDPSKGAASLIGKTFREFYSMPPPELISKPALDGLREIRKRDLIPDTVIFCESIEHISRKELAAAFELIKDMLTATSGLMIVTNWIDFHPIYKDSNAGWNHIATIDDATYDSLAAQAKSVVFRQGSHLVLQF